MRKQDYVIDFNKFLLEGTDVEETVDQVEDVDTVGEEQAELPIVEPAPVDDIQPEVEPMQSIDAPIDATVAPVAEIGPAQTGSKIVVLNGYAGHLDEVHPNKTITDSIIQKFGGDVQQVNLYQLNITPVTEEGREPSDGMTQVYDALNGADIVVVSTDLSKGQISSLMQVCLDRMANYYKGNMKNKIMASVITGAKDSYVAARGIILNFALEMGMLVGGDCNVFCATEDGQLGEYESEASNLVVVANQLAEATGTIRVDSSQLPSNEVGAMGGEGDILPFDEFDQAAADDALGDMDSYLPSTDTADGDQVHPFNPEEPMDAELGAEPIEGEVTDAPVEDAPVETEGDEFSDDEIQPFNPDEEEEEEVEEVTEEEEEDLMDFSTYESKFNK